MNSFIDDDETGKTNESKGVQQPTEDTIVDNKGKYNLDFLEDLSCINPFETKSKVNTSVEETNGEVSLKKINNLQDPESNLVSLENDSHDQMFSPEDLPNLEAISSNEKEKHKNSCLTESVAVLLEPTFNEITRVSPNPKRKISTPEFEEAERQFLMEEDRENESHVTSVHKSPPSVEDSLGLIPEQEYENSFMNQPNLLQKNIENEKFCQLTQKTEFLGAPLIDSSNDAKSKSDGSHLNSSATTTNKSRSKSKNDNVHIHWDEYNIQTTIEDKKVALPRSDDFVRMELHYQATLLDKDKLLHDKEKEIQSLDQDISLVKLEMERHESNNKGMLKVVNEYEKTISEVIADRERDRVCHQISTEKLARERDQTLEDLHSAERAFNDVHR